jgi:hypothetical protein
MKMSILRSVSFAAAAALLAAVPAGAQTFQNFVTVGDSLIAGEESGCVIQRFQKRSWVAITANLLGMSDFEQPWISEVAATTPLTGYPCLGLVLNGTSLGLAVVSETGQNTNLTLPRPYNNLGFNGSPLMADFVDLTVTTPGASDLDNLAGRVLRNCMGCPFQGMSAVDEANLLTPDLVAFWGGNNDVLNAMFAGVAIVGVTITPVDSFTNSANQVIAGLSAPGRTLITGDVPNIVDVPYATTIPPVVVDPTTMQPVIVNGQPVLLLGPGDDAYPCMPVPPDMGCGLPAGSLVMLPASTLLGQGYGLPTAVCPPGLPGCGLPLPHGTFTPPSTLNVGVVLYPDDVTLIESTIVAYDQAIAAAASANGATLIDSNALFAQVAANGFDVGGIHLSTAYATGGIFSYDGVHPAPGGYGIVADDFIQLLNTVKGTHIPRPNFSDILFTPNVPEIVSSAVTADGGAWHYTLDTWKGLLNAGLARRFAIVMPSAPEAPRVVPHLPPAPRAVRHVERHDFH